MPEPEGHGVFQPEADNGWFLGSFREREKTHFLFLSFNVYNQKVCIFLNVRKQDNFCGDHCREKTLKCNKLRFNGVVF